MKGQAIAKEDDVDSDATCAMHILPAVQAGACPRRHA